MSDERDPRPAPGPGQPQDGHPPEDVLISLALGEGGEAARAHVETCGQCRRLVEEMGEVKDTVASLGEEEPPEELRDLIWRTIRRPRVADSVQSVLQSPLSRTFLLGLVLVFYVIFMYVMIALLDMG